MTDLLLAICHHLLIFAVFGILIAELILVRRGMTVAAAVHVAKIDLLYGIFAMLTVAVGFARAVFAAKGWAYYSHNAFFWAKLGAFMLVALISIPPTLQYLAWRKVTVEPTDAQVNRVRRLLYAQIALFASLPIFAAAMARGFGEYH